MKTKPEIGSIWIAKDGRRMRVTAWTFGINGWWANLEVLPPHAPRQKRNSAMNLDNFSSGFLTLEIAGAEESCLK